ncbi:MAG: PDGLE domain-containing protein [Methanobrevibacter sp.]|jgi:cobalt/nickel transport protein|nr:PDGLE domain-containing protein [Methanobrevibacter sp.]
MKTNDKKLLLYSIVIVVIIAILAPFLASTNPDGLESTAKKLNPEALESEHAFQSLIPDYEIPGLSKGNPLSGVIAILIGVIVVFVIAYGIGYIFKKK